MSFNVKNPAYYWNKIAPPPFRRGINYSVQSGYHFPNLFHRGVDIGVHCGAYAGVPQNHAKGLYVKAAVHTFCGKAVAQNMEIHIPYSGVAQKGFKMPLHASRLYGFVRPAGNYEAVARPSFS